MRLSDLPEGTQLSQWACLGPVCLTLRSEVTGGVNPGSPVTSGSALTLDLCSYASGLEWGSTSQGSHGVSD